MSCNSVCKRNVKDLDKTTKHHFLGRSTSSHKISCFDVKDINDLFNNSINTVALSNQLRNRYRFFYKSDIFGNYYFDRRRILIERNPLFKFLPLLISYFNEIRGNNNMAIKILNLCNYLTNEVNYVII